MKRGYILDCYTDEKKDCIVTWILKENQKPLRLEHSFHPSFYVATQKGDLLQLMRLLQDLHEVRCLNLTEQRLMLGRNKTNKVLEVTPRRLADFHHLPQLIDAWGKHHQYQLFDVDTRIENRYLNQQDVFFNAHVSINTQNMLHLENDSRWAIDYNMPCWKLLYLTVEKPKSTDSYWWDHPLTSCTIDDEHITAPIEEDLLKELNQVIQRKNPDIIMTQGGDTFAIPYLYKRAKHAGLNHSFSLSRDTHCDSKKAMKQGKTYMSYGHIVYRPPFYMLKGRMHLDQTSSFFFQESGLHGLLDVSRCANLSLQLLSRIGPGTAMSQMQIDQARSWGYSIPWKKTQTESCKTALELLQSDRGGHILSPREGFFQGVFELDFASLYPSIMVKYNISPETMLCPCCTDGDGWLVPQLGYHICKKTEGLLPSVLRPVLTRRFCYKARVKHPDFDSEQYEALQKAWKWILVVCFGYTGYRNARFGRIECHESITAYARTMLLKAMHIAEDCGYRVLHGIVDSLWIQPSRDKESPQISPEEVVRLISKSVGVRMELAGRYRWIVFLKSKGCDVGALTRYYGVLDSGVVKARGVELRQRNTPMFFKQIQEGLLMRMAEVSSEEEIQGLLPVLFEYLRGEARRLKRNEIPLRELLLTTSVSRDASEYKVDNLVHAALLQAKRLGISVVPGQKIRYVVCDESCRDVMKRVRLEEALETGGDVVVDYGYYLRWLVRCIESVLLPFDCDRHKIFRELAC